MATAPIFHVVPGSAVKSAIDGNRQKIFEAVEAAYRLHAAGESVNPNSYFLRYPDNPTARIIALPAHLGGDHGAPPSISSAAAYFDGRPARRNE